MGVIGVIIAVTLFDPLFLAILSGLAGFAQKFKIGSGIDRSRVVNLQ
jgi:hypothetical protein